MVHKLMALVADVLGRSSNGVKHDATPPAERRQFDETQQRQLQRLRAIDARVDVERVTLRRP